MCHSYKESVLILINLDLKSNNMIKEKMLYKTTVYHIKKWQQQQALLGFVSNTHNLK